MLLQFEDVNGTCVVATVWGVPIKGREQLSCGSAATADTMAGQSSSCTYPSTVIFFIDAVTGRLIDAPGFGQK